MSPWISLAVTAALVVVLGGVLIRLQRGSAARRESRGLAGFLRHFDPSEVSEDVVIAVYRQLERWEAPSAPRPEHDLRARFGLLDAEVAHAVVQVSRACDRDPGDPRDVRTIDDWVRHVSRCPPAEAAAKP